MISPTAIYPAAKVVPSGVQPDLQTPTVESYTVKIERQIAPNTSLGVAYVGSRGYHQMLSLDPNVPEATICPALPCPAGYPAGAMYNPPNAPLANNALLNASHWFSEGISSYNGLEVDANHRLSRGLQFRGVYTFSKALDDGGSLDTSIATNSPAFVANSLRPLKDYGPGSFDIRNAGVLNATYDLPSLQGRATNTWLDGIAANWQISVVSKRCCPDCYSRRSCPTTHQTTGTGVTRCGLP